MSDELISNSNLFQNGSNFSSWWSNFVISSLGCRTRVGLAVLIVVVDFVGFSSSILCSNSALSYLSSFSYCFAANSSCSRHFFSSAFDATSSKYFCKRVISVSPLSIFSSIPQPKAFTSSSGSPFPSVLCSISRFYSSTDAMTFPKASLCYSIFSRITLSKTPFVLFTV